MNTLSLQSKSMMSLLETNKSDAEEVESEQKEDVSSSLASEENENNLSFMSNQDCNKE